MISCGWRVNMALLTLVVYYRQLSIDGRTGVVCFLRLISNGDLRWFRSLSDTWRTYWIGGIPRARAGIAAFSCRYVWLESPETSRSTDPQAAAGESFGPIHQTASRVHINPNQSGPGQGPINSDSSCFCCSCSLFCLIFVAVVEFTSMMTRCDSISTGRSQFDWIWTPFRWLDSPGKCPDRLGHSSD